MSAPSVLERIQALDAYAPGLSIAEIRRRHGLENVIKLASNENPLGASPLAQEAIRRNAGLAFRYPQGGNPRLREALARLHGVDPGRIVVGNGSDEIIDLAIRMLAAGGEHNIVCCEPCFSIYPIQARVAGVGLRRRPLREDFSQDLDGLADLADAATRLVFVTTPDNPSGYCPPREDVLRLARRLAERAPGALLVVDEAYMDFAGDEAARSLLHAGELPENVAVLRTFSKSWGLAGLRLGYGIVPPAVADGFWRSRLPFSVNVLAEEAALAAMEDTVFRAATLGTVREGRRALADGLTRLGCRVWPSEANFLMFRLPEGHDARACFEGLLRRGIIIRPLASYGLADHLRVSVGTPEENAAFLAALGEELAPGAGA
ncbi:MAG: histidinol-phosphate transaminase [Desulfovibrio sp.]|nr:histidinol-phosphate transaminase [Desulfovibrio sp.]